MYMYRFSQLPDTRLDAMTGKVGELESAEKDQLEKLDDRKAEIESLKRDISRLKSIEEEVSNCNNGFVRWSL